MLRREGGVGQDVLLGLVHQPCQLREPRTEAIRYPSPLLAGTRGAGLGEDGADARSHHLLGGKLEIPDRVEDLDSLLRPA
jgi:hypothetical protein